MPRAQFPLRTYLDTTKIKEKGKSTRQHPCTFCGNYVSNVSREILYHFQHCSSITADKKPIIEKIIQNEKLKKKNQSIKSTVSPYARVPVPMSPASSLSSLSICSPVQQLPPSPPSKKRKLSFSQSTLETHFIRNINSDNYKVALKYLFMWILSSNVSSMDIIDSHFINFVQFFCPSFVTKFKNDDIEHRILEFKQNLKNTICKNLKQNCGFLGVYFNSTSYDVSLWILTKTTQYYVATVSYEAALNEVYEMKDEDDQKNENMFENCSLYSLVRKLKKLNFSIMGIKLNCDLITNELLHKKIQEFSFKISAVMVGNLKSKFEAVINDLLEFEAFNIEMNKLKVLINFIKTHHELKIKLEQKFKDKIPTHLLSQLNFISKVKSLLKTLSSNDTLQIEAEVRKILFLDVAFWDSMNHLGSLFNEMIDTINLIHNDTHLTFSVSFESIKKLIKYYKECESPLFNQQKFLNFRKKILNALKGIFVKLSNNETIFAGDGALFYLANFIDPKYQIRAKIHQMRASVDLLNAMTTLDNKEEFNRLYLDLRCKRNEFSTQTFRSFDDMQGTELNDFAQFCISIVGASATPLDILLTDHKGTPDVIDLFCFYNSQNYFS